MKIIRIDGIVGDFLNTTEEFKYRVEALELEVNEELKVIINSVGGSVFEGFGIYNYLVALPNPIITETEGLGASIATLIAFAAAKENAYISQISMFMVHKASTGVQGNSEELEKQAEILKSIDETLISVYVARTGKTRNQIEKEMSAETWMTADNAVKEGYFLKANIINQIEAKVAAKAHSIQIKENMTLIEKLVAAYKAKAETTEAKVEAKTEEKVEEKVEATAEETTEEKVEEKVEETDEEKVEETTEEVVDTVSKVDFDRLCALVEGIAEVVNSSLNQTASVEEQVTASFAAHVRKLPTSIANPKKGANNLNKTENAYVPKYQNFRERLKGIEAKTRIV